MSTKHNANRWTSPDELDNDLLLMSDFGVDPEVRPSPKPSPRHRTARAKASLYDDEYDLYDSNPPCRPTRGHPLLRGDGGLLPPGGTPSFLQRQYETSREIREVCGLGYSNDIIERALRRGPRPPEADSKLMPDIALSKSSSSSSSAASSPAKSRTAKHRTASSKNSDSETSREDQENEKEKPAPPLYEILKSKRKELGARKKCHNNFLWSNGEKELDIYSKTDFPDLG